MKGQVYKNKKAAQYVMLIEDNAEIITDDDSKPAAIYTPFMTAQ